MASKGHAQQQVKSSGQASNATQIKQFENLKTLLKNAKSTQGKDLYSHLQEVFKQLILHYPDQALEKLEEVSYLIKHNGSGGIRLENFLVIEEIKNYKHFTDGLQNYVAAMETHFKKAVSEEEGEEPPELGPIGNVPDLLVDSKLYEWGGIGFGEQETYRIMKSLKKLVTQTQATNIRFFGKIYGTEKDYYIAEGVLEGGDEEGGEDQEKPADFEARGSGVNKFVYWVTDNVLSKWTKLPDLLPQDIVATRQIKVSFTGNLDRQIFTNPHFFGTEKIYLRAQIARMVHSTSLCPKGLFRLVEDNDKEIEEMPADDGPLPLPSTIAMSKAENWVHYSQSILQIGRVSHMDPVEPEGVEDFDVEKAKKEIEAKDPYEPRLKPITMDKPVEVGCGWTGHGAPHNYQTPWVVKLMGDPTEYIDPQNGKNKVCYGVVVVRSLQWPGQFTFYSNGKYINIYVGNGQKYETQSYYPLYPPLIKQDPLEYGEQPEPTPLYEDPIPEQQIEGGEEGGEGGEEGGMEY